MINVVIVERDPALARLYQEELSEAGFNVRVGRGLHEACACLRNQPAHILVTDLDSVDGPLSAGLTRLRKFHQGPLVLLGPAKAQRNLPERDLLLVEKTSDLTPLISHLRGKTLSVIWTGALAASC